MASDSRAAIAALMVIVIFGGSLAVCFWPSGDKDEGFTVSGEVTGLSSYNQPKLDIQADEIFSQGAELGSLFTVQTETQTFEGAIMLGNYLGLFMFDIFVNVESDGYISIGCVGKLIVAEQGSQVTLTYTGTSDRYAKTPCYNGGSTNNRADYASDEEFANFYEVTGGDLKSGVLYRSFSPLYAPDKQARSVYVNQLAEKVGIQYEIALSYNSTSVEKATQSLEGYCIDLCKEGKYVAPGMGYLYFQDKDKTISVLRGIMDNDGPYLVHCNVGRDRTGFVILLIQSLCGCTAAEMQENEARAFCNLYHMDEGSTEYNVVVESTYARNMYFIANPDQIPNIFEIDWDDVDVSSVDTYSAAYSYCTDYLGLTADEVSGLVAKLCA